MQCFQVDRRVAMAYSGAKDRRGIVLEFEVGAIDCGARLDPLSQYPGIDVDTAQTLGYLTDVS